MRSSALVRATRVRVGDSGLSTAVVAVIMKAGALEESRELHTLDGQDKSHDTRHTTQKTQYARR